MIVFVNGEYLPEERAVVSVYDRGLLYGDGLFETLLVRRAKPFRLEQHLDRLGRGAAYLRIELPMVAEDIGAVVRELIGRNNLASGVVRIGLTRGVGKRGYSPRGADCPSLFVTVQRQPEADLCSPPEWKLVTSSLRVPVVHPPAMFKTSNKLVHVLARMEAEEVGANDALLLDTRGEALETAAANLFWIQAHTVCTPPTASGALPGVTRAVVMELCPAVRLPLREEAIAPEALRFADGIFVTLSTLGIVEVTELDGERVSRSPLTDELRRRYWELVERESS